METANSVQKYLNRIRNTVRVIILLTPGEVELVQNRARQSNISGSEVVHHSLTNYKNAVNAIEQGGKIYTQKQPTLLEKILFRPGKRVSYPL